MILAIDAQIQLLLGEVSHELAGQMDATHGKDRRAYELLSAASCLIGSANLMMRHDPDVQDRKASWSLVQAAHLVTKSLDLPLPKLRTMSQLDRLYRID